MHDGGNMTNRVLIGAPLAGAFALVVWGMLFWAVLYKPLHVFEDLPPAVTDAAAAFAKDDVPTGTYFFPWPRDTPEARATWQIAHAKGPFFQLQYVKEGINPDAPGKLALGLLHYLVVAALALGLCVALGARGRAAFFAVVLGGAMGSVYGELSAPIWFALPWHFSSSLFFYDVVSWLVLGAVMAYFTRQRG